MIRGVRVDPKLAVNLVVASTWDWLWRCEHSEDVLRFCLCGFTATEARERVAVLEVLQEGSERPSLKL